MHIGLLNLQALRSASTTIDKTGSSIRLLDAMGSLSSVGLLQIPTGAAFGTVCGMNLGAADVVCIQLSCIARSAATCLKQLIF